MAEGEPGGRFTAELFDRATNTRRRRARELQHRTGRLSSRPAYAKRGPSRRRIRQIADSRAALAHDAVSANGLAARSALLARSIARRQSWP
jgi:hypothetical protein